METLAWLLTEEGNDLRAHDMTILATDQNRLVPAHRVVIASASSKLFEFLKSNALDEQNDTATFIFPTHSAIDAFFSFCYCCRLCVDNLSPEDTKFLYEFARHWEIPRLVTVLSHRVTNEPPARNVKHVLQGTRVNLSPFWGEDKFADVLVRVVGIDCSFDVPASRAVLSAKSRFFRHMFSSNWLEANNRVVVVNLTNSTLSFPFAPHDVVDAIRFMYERNKAVCNKISFVVDDTDSETEKRLHSDVMAIAPLLFVAGYLGYDEMQEWCCDVLKDHVLTSSTACDLWVLAEQTSSDALSEACQKHTEENFVAVSASAGFENLPLHLLREALLCGNICCGTQHVFAIIDDWASKQHPSTQKRVAELLPPHTLLTREWKHMLLRGLPCPLPHFLFSRR